MHSLHLSAVNGFHDCSGFQDYCFIIATERCYLTMHIKRKGGLDLMVLAKEGICLCGPLFSSESKVLFSCMLIIKGVMIMIIFMIEFPN